VMLCNKICGVAHYNMRMKVVVVEPSEFKDWLKNEKPVFEAPAAAAPATDSTAAPVTALK
jgi:cytochrome c oxidase subunit II